MINIGCHLSASKGFKAMAQSCLAIGANTFQFFTRNPRGGSAKKIDRDDIETFLKIFAENNFAKIVAHAPYTMNLCSVRESTIEFSKRMMSDDLKRMEYIPGNLYNFHPGSHVGQGTGVGIEKIADALNEILYPEMNTTVLLETMSGKGSEIGGNFEEIARIIDKIKLQDKVGVCLDSCHVSDAGYNIIEDLDGVIKRFDSAIGLDRLKAIHLNDSKNPIGSRKDRHEKIGDGFLGTDTIEKIVNRSEFQGLPFILETPQENLEGYKNEIKFVKGLVK